MVIAVGLIFMALIKITARIFNLIPDAPPYPNSFQTHLASQFVPAHILDSIHLLQVSEGPEPFVRKVRRTTTNAPYYHYIYSF